jgi:protein-S-isoprenylcysteine O-methyltransferase Ste14
MTTTSQPQRTSAVAIGGALAFAASMLFGAFAYGVTFAQSVSTSSSTRSVAIDIALFAAFGVHHSLFARASFKRHVRRWAGPDVERSVYVWIASALFMVMVACWQPVPGTLWRANTAAGWLLTLAQLAGAILMIRAGRFTDVRDLAGLPAASGPGRQELTEPISRGPYGVIRHPLYLAFLLLLWPVHVMTGTRLLFAGLFTLYVLVAIPLEERDLRRTFGEGYERYAGRVRHRLLPGVY